MKSLQPAMKQAGRRMRAAVLLGLIATTALAYGAHLAHADVVFNGPSGVAVDRAGNIYVADTNEGAVVKLSSSGRVLGRWSASPDYRGSSPSALAVDRNANVYVADSQNDRVVKYSSHGRFLGMWGSPGDGEFSSPSGIAVGGRGNVFVASPGNQTIEKLSPDGYVLTSWRTDSSVEQNAAPYAVALDRQGDIFAVVSNLSPDCACGSFAIQKRSSNGELLDEWGPYDGLGGIAVDRQGNVLVTNTADGTVMRLTPDGRLLAEFGSFDNPLGVAVGGRGNIFVADQGNDDIVKLLPNGRPLDVWH